MRYSIGRQMVVRKLVLAMVLGGLGTLPQSANAQAAEQSEATEQAVDAEPAPSSEPASEEPALQLELDAAGVEVVPSPPWTVDGYTLEEMELRVRRARGGLLGMAGAAVLGLVVLAAGASSGSNLGAAAAGLVLAAGGVAGMIPTGIVFGLRKRKLHRHQQELRSLEPGQPDEEPPAPRPGHPTSGWSPQYYDIYNKCRGVCEDDGNACTRDCDPRTGTCDYIVVGDGTDCDFDGVAGVCIDGACEENLCQGVVCPDDGNECTQNLCNFRDGTCDFPPVRDGKPCGHVVGGACLGGICTTQ